MKLFHGSKLIGILSNIAPEDMFLMSADIQVTPEFEEYKLLFEFLLSNDGLTDGSDPYEDAVYENWSLEHQDGKRQSIGIPSIENGEIMWRE